MRSARDHGCKLSTSSRALRRERLAEAREGRPPGLREVVAHCLYLFLTELLVQLDRFFGRNCQNHPPRNSSPQELRLDAEINDREQFLTLERVGRRRTLERAYRLRACCFCPLLLSRPTAITGDGERTTRIFGCEGSGQAVSDEAGSDEHWERTPDSRIYTEVQRRVI
jgi:hypothetical protein